MDANSIETASLFRSLEGVGQRSPYAPAIVDSGSSITFSELIDRSSGLCTMLEEAGVRSGDRTALILSNSAAFVISAFAVWKLGGILVPLHVRLLEGEILKYVSDCGVRAIITTQRMSSTVELVQGKIAAVEHAWLWQPAGSQLRYLATENRQPLTQTTDRPTADLTIHRPAVTLFSTGSTGLSRCVTRSHRQLIGEVECVSRVMRLGVHDRILGAIPFFHSYGLVSGFLCGILSGCRVYAVNDFFPKDIASLIEREQITGFPGVPFMYQLLADLGAAADFRSLRYALSGGAPLLQSTAEKFRSKYGVPIRQHYGTTETGFISVEPEPADEANEPSVGIPIPGVSIQILDDAQRTVSQGEPGNVAIRSCFAASGYDGPEKSAESSFEGEFFFPGDLGRIGSDGRLILCGRKRGFINVAGNKVDPGEVEAVLKQLPAVSEAVVVGVSDGAAGEKVKAVLVTTAPCTRNDVYAHCSSRLAEFKRPRSIEFRKELPRSPVGKILRKYLIDDHHERRPEYAFDPRFGFRPSADALSNDSVTSSLATLSPVLRSLLVTDGTVTKFLEAFFWEPIDVELLLHAEAESGRDYPDMGVQAKDPLLRRRVILRGRFTTSAYVFAETIIASNGFSPIFRRMLVEGRKGIGEIIREERVETYRELMAVERTCAGQWAGYLGLETTARVTVRRYNIRHSGRVVTQITEVFPEDRF